MNKLFMNITLFMIAIIFLQCTRDQKISQPTPVEARQVQKIGDAYAMTLLKKLKNALQTSIQTDGVENAVAVCNTKALPLTHEAESDGVEIKRTSFEYRNPENAPDETERLALAYFEQQLQQTGNLPQNYFQKVRETDGVYYYYYKPLKMQPLCLSCHGNPQKMPAALVNRLDELYPQDKARGYNEGDFRGVVRVKISAQRIDG